MKNSIKLSVLLLLFSTGVFAATPAHSNTNGDIRNVISVNALQSSIGITVGVEENLTKRPFISITDTQGHELYAENLSTQAGTIKTYNLTELENGDYTVTITANKQKMQEKIHIYDEYGQKTFFIIQ